MKSTTLSSVTEESTFVGTMFLRSVGSSSGSSAVVDSYLCTICQPKYLTLNKSESKLYEDIGYVIDVWKWQAQFFLVVFALRS